MAGPDDREYYLKMFQANIDSKFKLATFATIGNAGALITILTALKDKGAEFFQGLHVTVLLPVAGIFVGALAYFMAAFVAERGFIRLVKLMMMNEKDFTNVAEPKSFAIPDGGLFYVLILMSGFCFVVTVGMAPGFVDQILSFKPAK